MEMISIIIIIGWALDPKLNCPKTIFRGRPMIYQPGRPTTKREIH